mgnify:CR=1 FL=1
MKDVDTIYSNCDAFAAKLTDGRVVICEVAEKSGGISRCFKIGLDLFTVCFVEHYINKPQLVGRQEVLMR